MAIIAQDEGAQSRKSYQERKLRFERLSVTAEKIAQYEGRMRAYIFTFDYEDLSQSRDELMKPFIDAHGTEPVILAAVDVSASAPGAKRLRRAHVHGTAWLPKRRLGAIWEVKRRVNETAPVDAQPWHIEPVKQAKGGLSRWLRYCASSANLGRSGSVPFADHRTEAEAALTLCGLDGEKSTSARVSKEEKRSPSRARGRARIERCKSDIPTPSAGPTKARAAHSPAVTPSSGSKTPKAGSASAAGSMIPGRDATGEPDAHQDRDYDPTTGEVIVTPITASVASPAAEAIPAAPIDLPPASGREIGDQGDQIVVGADLLGKITVPRSVWDAWAHGRTPEPIVAVIARLRSARGTSFDQIGLWCGVDQSTMVHSLSDPRRDPLSAAVVDRLRAWITSNPPLPRATRPPAKRQTASTEHQPALFAH